jgi:hypothetical protein
MLYDPAFVLWEEETNSYRVLETKPHLTNKTTPTSTYSHLTHMRNCNSPPTEKQWVQGKQQERNKTCGTPSTRADSLHHYQRCNCRNAASGPSIRTDRQLCTPAKLCTTPVRANVVHMTAAACETCSINSHNTKPRQPTAMHKLLGHNDSRHAEHPDPHAKQQ